MLEEHWTILNQRQPRHNMVLTPLSTLQGGPLLTVHADLMEEILDLQINKM